MKQAVCILGQRGGRLLVVIIIGLLLCGCLSMGSKKAEPVVASYRITFSATREANVNQEKKPAPLKISVFYLRSDSGFMSADFFALHNKAAAVLGENLMGTEQFFLLPGGETVKISGEKKSERYYIGVTGEFQDLNNKTWRIIIPIPDPEKVPFYKFWRGQPPPQEIKVVANGQGLRVTENSNKEK
ncbi:type VI secretion system lipoprotein TssJ [Serratia oryzae]|uniref:Type VI secretion system-associated lipoprotein n=1 Tax=Serratia oryzae TaxID=2034155 RepID=A0A1S8CM95_9GAMM|nr:type VI secretion system lipoprotein TssJ [Serratia oryzae]OMQ25465.1 type VI secretion system-associated lipoprotein [Serratia oryzae]VXC53848.1 Type VI secretion system-associated lipoprotein [Enterobacterales bacterium 8AC]